MPVCVSVHSALMLHAGMRYRALHLGRWVPLRCLKPEWRAQVQHEMKCIVLLLSKREALLLHACSKGVLGFREELAQPASQAANPEGVNFMPTLWRWFPWQWTAPQQTR